MDQLLWVGTVNRQQQRLVVMKDTQWMEVKFYTVDQMDSGVKTNQLVKVSHTFALWMVTVFTMAGHTWSGCQAGQLFYFNGKIARIECISKGKSNMFWENVNDVNVCFLFRRKIDEVLPTLSQSETDLLKKKTDCTQTNEHKSLNAW